MRLIAVASHNGRTVTGDAGRCRRFLLFGDRGGSAVGTVELSPEQCLQQAAPAGRHPLASIAVLISAGIGEDLAGTLERLGIDVVVTGEPLPDTAVRRYLAGEGPGGGRTHVHP